MTLIEELEQAAREARMMANSARAVGLWETEGVRQEAFAAALRARIAHIRELEAIAEAMTHNRVRLEAIRDVTGPIAAHTDAVAG